MGFYAVVPFIATVLTHDFELGGAAIGFVLGVRTFSQQGAFLLGGLLADRFGARTMILIGCAVRCCGFLTLAASLWGPEPQLHVFLLGTVLTGFGGALFSPALSTLVAAVERHVALPHGRVTLFAWLTVLGEAGAAIGPLLGAALLPWGFAATSCAGAALFAAVGLLLWLILPGGTPQRAQAATASVASATDGAPPLSKRQRTALKNPHFATFAAIHAVDLLAYNQLYLSIPTELQRVGSGSTALALVFTWVSVLTVTLQVPVARWSARRPARICLRIGYACHASAFTLLGLCAPWTAPDGFELAPAFTTATLVTLGHLFALPTAMHSVNGFAGNAATGSYFGLLATIGGFLVLVGNIGIGSLLDHATSAQPAAALPWLCLAALPAVSALAVTRPWIWKHTQEDG